MVASLGLGNCWPMRNVMHYAEEVESKLKGTLENFVATFKDNPGRRLISLCLGGLVGIVVAASLGLDLFAALTKGPTSIEPRGYELVQGMRFALTGFVIGLGSGPTHEVIRLLQEFEQTRKGQNASQPDQP